MQTPKQIFPKEIVEYSVEKHFNTYDPRSNRVYLAVLALIIVAIILMFILKVDVSVRSGGIIKSVQDRTDIRTAINGIVDTVYVSENTHVIAGQAIMSVHSQSLENTSDEGSDLQEMTEQVADLKNLLNDNPEALTSAFYTQQYKLYQQKLSNAQIRYNLASRNYERFNKLYRKKVIAPAEYDKYEFQRRAVESDISTLKEQQITQWQADYNRLSVQLNNMVHVVKAPANGYVQQLKGMQKGSVVTPNEILGEVTPDSGLIAEAYVLPKDIGLLHTGVPVRMQVDAFDYTQWGMIEGKIISISNDIFTDEGQPYFKVRCQLNEQKMKLKNGYEGKLKKGMTMQARFVIARRTIFQLLYDQTDDWLNPNISNNATTAQK